MSNVDKTPEEVLRDAGAAADALIPQVERQRDEAQKNFAALEAKLNYLRNVAATAKAVVGQTGLFIVAGSGMAPKVTNVTATTSVSTAAGETFTIVRPPEANVPVADKIAFVLASENRPLTTRELATVIDSKFGQEVPMSTIYAALSKGREAGRFVNNDGAWIVKKSEGQG